MASGATFSQLGVERKVKTRTVHDILNEDEPVNGSNGAEHGNEPA
jgi:hypothetical protein